jgi:phenylpropionate dioxygenase-like ring-hydroxylating dioxygenase large terminal subunit
LSTPNHPAHIRLVRKLLAQVNDRPANAKVGEIAASRYVSPEHFEAERTHVFARVPSIVALEADLPEPGSCLAADVAGVSLLVVRDDEGKLRAFRNACRHRSTALVSAPCKKKAFVCPYHGWTYDLRGSLIHVPGVESFRGANELRTALVGAHVESRHGFVFAAPFSFDLDAHLGPIDGELSTLRGGVLYQRSERDIRGNWKLVIDAFLDGYHIRHLHRDSIYRFFADARFEVERAGHHIRAVTARRTLFETKDIDASDLRTLVTPSYLVFPNVILILHPDYLSVLSAIPLAPNRTRVTHAMLIPSEPKTEVEHAHWKKSFELIDEGVFAREDLSVVEAMQRGIESGANETLLFGELEHASLWFQASLDEHLAMVKLPV